MSAYYALSQPCMDDSPGPLDDELRMAREILDQTAISNVHDGEAMIRAAVGLRMRLRGLLGALDADRGKDTSRSNQPQAGESTSGDYFQVGHTYTQGLSISLEPTPQWTFVVAAIAESPRGDRCALGFLHGATYGCGVWTAHGEPEFLNWTDVTQPVARATGDPRGEAP
jgi:hypothetical protein